MNESIETFYAIDFDRCLGNFDATLSLINDIAEDMSALSAENLTKANDKVKASGRSFMILKYLKDNDPDLDLDAVQKEFIRRAQVSPESLLEPGALELIDYLRSQDYQHCIMTFGDEAWQTTKVVAAGLRDTTTLVVGHERKSHIISEWREKTTGKFTIPGECFTSNMPKLAKEVVLIDDKPNAFVGLSEGALGYLVSKDKILPLNPLIKLSRNVIQITCLNEIIDLEKRRKNPSWN